MHQDVTFAVPVTGSQFAPEVMYLTGSGDASDELQLAKSVNEVSVLVDTLVTSAEIVVELRSPDGADWIEAESITEAGLAPLIQLASWRGVRVRVRSGGSAGNQRVVVFWR